MTFYARGKPGDSPVFSRNASFLPSELGDEVVVAVDEMPDFECLIADDGKSLVPVTIDLATAQAQRWSEAKDYRDSYAAAGCQTPLGVKIDTDPDSQRKLNGAVTAALIQKTLGQPFSVDWTMLDNSVVTVSGDEMIELGLLVVRFMSECQAAGTAIRNAILAATTAVDAAAIDITAGYPA